MIKEQMGHKTLWIIDRYMDQESLARGECFSQSIIPGNLLLNEGITELLKLGCGIAATAFSNANAYLGVGDSTDEVEATQVGLQAAVNKAYAAMVVGYPTVTNQTMTFRSEFASGVGNFSWQEFTIANGDSDASVNINRKVSNQGTKVAGQVWVVTLEITLS